jgi:pimeloyl-ACP methyl ester carboxylesterase
MSWPSFAGTVIVDDITSSALAGNLLGDPNERHMTIYLPEEYDTDVKHYPVIYFLHGRTGDYANMGKPPELGFHYINDMKLHEFFDGLITQGKIPPVIVVFVDGNNTYEGSFFASSSVIGDYETYITQEIVSFVDSKYRTISQRESRALAGASMGARGALTLSMRYPGIYAAVGTISSPIDVDLWKTYMLAWAKRPEPKSIQEAAAQNLPYVALYGLASAYSPNPQNPPLYIDYPMERPSGEVIPEIWEKWRAVGSPFHMAEKHQSVLRELELLYMGVGDNRTLDYTNDNERFIGELKRLGIPHEFVLWPGGHQVDMDGTLARIEDLVVALANVLSTEVITATRSHNHLTATWGIIKDSR